MLTSPVAVFRHAIIILPPFSDIAAFRYADISFISLPYGECRKYDAEDTRPAAAEKGGAVWSVSPMRRVRRAERKIYAPPVRFIAAYAERCASTPPPAPARRPAEIARFFAAACAICDAIDVFMLISPPPAFS